MQPRARILALVSALTLAIVRLPGSVSAAPPQDGGVIVLQPAAHDVGASIAHAPQSDRSLEVARRAIGKAPGGGNRKQQVDGALQSSATTPNATIAAGVNVD